MAGVFMVSLRVLSVAVLSTTLLSGAAPTASASEVSTLLDPSEGSNTGVPDFSSYVTTELDSGSELAPSGQGDRPWGGTIASGAALSTGALRVLPEIVGKTPRAPSPVVPLATALVAVGALVEQEAPQLDPGGEEEREQRRLAYAAEFEHRREREERLKTDLYVGDPLDSDIPSWIFPPEPPPGTTQWVQWDLQRRMLYSPGESDPFATPCQSVVCVRDVQPTEFVANADGEPAPETVSAALDAIAGAGMEGLLPSALDRRLGTSRVERRSLIDRLMRDDLVARYGDGSSYRYYLPGRTPPEEFVRIVGAAGDQGVSLGELRRGQLIPQYTSDSGLASVIGSALALRDGGGRPLVTRYGESSEIRYYVPGQTPPEQLLRLVTAAGDVGVSPGELIGGVLPHRVGYAAVRAVAADVLALMDVTGRPLVVEYGGHGTMRYYGREHSPPEQLVRLVEEAGDKGISPMELVGNLPNYGSRGGVSTVVLSALALREMGWQPRIVRYGGGNNLRYYAYGHTPPDQLVRVVRVAGKKGVSAAELKRDGLIQNHTSIPGISVVISDALALRDGSGGPRLTSYGEPQVRRYYAPGLTPPEQLIELVAASGSRGISPGELVSGGQITNYLGVDGVHVVIESARQMTDRSGRPRVVTYGRTRSFRFYVPGMTPPEQFTRLVAAAGSSGLSRNELVGTDLIPGYSSEQMIDNIAADARALRDTTGAPLVVVYGPYDSRRYYAPAYIPNWLRRSAAGAL